MCVRVCAYACVYVQLCINNLVWLIYVSECEVVRVDAEFSFWSAGLPDE